jgi:hypothetical protein
VEDETWIREVTADGLVIFMKNDQIRRKPSAEPDL